MGAGVFIMLPQGATVAEKMQTHDSCPDGTAHVPTPGDTVLPNVVKRGGAEGSGRVQVSSHEHAQRRRQNGKPRRARWPILTVQIE